MDFRIGQGYDVHALAEGLPMWLGGVQIPSPTGFVAHSDGDVAIHALCDGAQSLKPERFAELMGELKGIARIIGRDL